MSLIERLEAAEGGSRDLDFEMHQAFPPKSLDDALASGRVTTSLDAALALAERVLPGWVWQLDVEPSRAWAQGAAEPWPEGLVASDRGGAYAGGDTPALALCIAILKAKETK